MALQNTHNAVGGSFNTNLASFGHEHIPNRSRPFVISGGREPIGGI